MAKKAARRKKTTASAPQAPTQEQPRTTPPEPQQTEKPAAPEKPQRQPFNAAGRKLTPPEGATSGSHQITLPVMDSPAPAGMYLQRHLELRLNNDEAEKVKRLTFGLQMAGVDIKDGKHALRWLIDQIPITA